MKKYLIDFNDDIYQLTGIGRDAVAMKEFMVQSHDGEACLLQLIKKNVRGRETLYISLKDALGLTVPDLKADYRDRTISMDKTRSEEALVVDDLEKDACHEFYVFSASMDVELGLTVLLELPAGMNRISAELRHHLQQAFARTESCDRDHCPTPDTLDAYVRNELDTAGLDDVTSHLLTCGSCLDQALDIGQTHREAWGETIGQAYEEDEWADPDREAPSLQSRLETALLIRKLDHAADGLPDDETTPWADLVEKVSNSVREGLKRHDKHASSILPATGDLRMIRLNFPAGFYKIDYHPPLVLVLKLGAGHSDMALVAQIYSDPLLAAFGDLVVTGEYTGGMPPFMIETHNIYTLPYGFLGDCIAQVPQNVITAAMDLAADSSAYPIWAPIPPHLHGRDDPRQAFWNLEIQVGHAYTLAGQLKPMIGLVGEWPLAEKPQNTQVGQLEPMIGPHQSLETFVKAFHQLPVELPPASDMDYQPLDLLYLAGPAQGEALLYCDAIGSEASATAIRTVAMLYLLKQGRLANAVPVEAVITDRGHDENRMTMAGVVKIETITHHITDYSFRWHRSGLPSVPAAEFSLDLESGEFWATFNLPREEPNTTWRLAICLVAED